MSEIRDYMAKAFACKIKKAVISKPADKQAQYKKITVELLPKYYQVAKYTEKQVFHENVEADTEDSTEKFMIFMNVPTSVDIIYAKG